MSREPSSFGDFELVRLLAKGGTAEIFLAHEKRKEGPGRELVLKRLLPHLRSEKRVEAMFFDEARLAARFQHPNVVACFQSGCIDNWPYMVLEFVAGPNLARLRGMGAENGREIPAGVVARCGADIAAGLQHIHVARDEHGEPLNVVHRDVSPHNVVVGSDGRGKLIDFGVARNERMLRDTGSGHFKGKFGYVSPEMADLGSVDQRSDLFSLGVVLWEMLSGRKLFSGRGPGQVLQLIRECRVPSLREYREGLPEGLVQLVESCLEREPASRPQSAGLLSVALAELARGMGADSAVVAEFVAELTEAGGFDPRGAELRGSDLVVDRAALAEETTSGLRSGTVWREK